MNQKCQESDESLYPTVRELWQGSPFSGFYLPGRTIDAIATNELFVAGQYTTMLAAFALPEYWLRYVFSGNRYPFAAFYVCNAAFVNSISDSVLYVFSKPLQEALAIHGALLFALLP